MPEGYWKASGQFLKEIGKLLGNAPIPAVSHRKGGKIAQPLSAKMWQFMLISSEALHFCLL
jgi:hypothetical protein